MSDIETSDWSELAANNIQPAPGGWPPNSSPMIVYSNGREDMGAIKRDWNRRNPTVMSGGSANAQTLTYVQGPTAYVQGQTFTFFSGFNNSGACTLNVNGLGAKAILFGSLPLVGGELVTGGIVQVVYDSTQFLIIGASAGRTSTAGYLPLAGGTLTGPLIVPGPLYINNTVASGARAINFQTSGVQRWQLVTTSAAEGGSNAGSDFWIQRYNDAGTVIDTPLTINRANGAANFAGTLSSNSTIQSNGGALVLNGAAGTARQFFGQTSNAIRWRIVMGDATAEGGSNAGSNFAIQRYNDAGAAIDNPIAIVRSTGVTTFSVAIVNGPSDRSLKENIAPLEDSLDKVLALQGVSFDFIKDETKRRQIGLIAQDVAPVVPEVMQDFIQPDEEPKLAIDCTRLVPLLVEAIKELTAKVTVLEARLPPETLTA